MVDPSTTTEATAAAETAVAATDETLDDEDYAPVRPAWPVKSKGNKAQMSDTGNVLLSPHYRLTKLDVINGRGRKCYNHIGNRRFRQMASLNLKRYFDAPLKTEKTHVVHGLVTTMKEACPSGGFLKKDKVTGRWLSIGGRDRLDKVGHCMRDMIASMRDDPKRAESMLFLNRDTMYPDRNRMPPQIMPLPLTPQQQNILNLMESGFQGPTQELLRKAFR